MRRASRTIKRALNEFADMLIYNSTATPKGTNPSSNQPARNQTSYSSSNKRSHPPAAQPGKPSSLSTAKDPTHHNQVQHQEYHQISTKWNVRRTPADHYPPRPSTSYSKQRKPTVKPPQQQQPVSPLQAQAQKILEVLEYEIGKGHTDFQGNSGEHFSSWATRFLQQLADDAQALDPSQAQRCRVIANGLKNYPTMDTSTRSLTVREAKIATQGVVAIAAQQPALPSMMMSSSSSMAPVSSYQQQQQQQPASNAPTLAVNNDDDAALEAHEEETQPPTFAAAGVSTAPTTATQPEQQQQEEEEWVIVRGRKVKSSTVAFRKQFEQAAAALVGDTSASIADLAVNGEQRSAVWMALRDRRLTASAFSKALGFFQGDREGLWEEKIGLRAPFAGNDATRWGVKSEPIALECYQQLTGQQVEPCMFQVKHDDATHGWLGASPDGLIGGLGIGTSLDDGNDDSDSTTTRILVDNNADNQGPGILEIKCPYNKGRPDLAVPPEHAIWYYMPQIQGLMDIFNRNWCNLYIWTPEHGSVVFHINRDKSYWKACYDVLAEFWWVHVVPARQASDAGTSIDTVQQYRPTEHHISTTRLKEWSKTLAREAKATRFAPVSSAS